MVSMLLIAQRHTHLSPAAEHSQYFGSRTTSRTPLASRLHCLFSRGQGSRVRVRVRVRVWVRGHRLTDRHTYTHTVLARRPARSGLGSRGPDASLRGSRESSDQAIGRRTGTQQLWCSVYDSGSRQSPSRLRIGGFEVQAKVWDMESRGPESRLSAQGPKSSTAHPPAQYASVQGPESRVQSPGLSLKGPKSSTAHPAGQYASQSKFRLKHVKITTPYHNSALRTGPYGIAISYIRGIGSGVRGLGSGPRAQPEVRFGPGPGAGDKSLAADHHDSASIYYNLTMSTSTGFTIFD
eukprot:234158-Rhodomonas_salina.1